MPRVVNHDARRRQIARAAMSLIAREGAAALTLRAIARELGGSLTLVTHYYPNRASLLQDLAKQLTEAWSADLADREKGLTDPVARLRGLLDWLLPLTAEDRQEEWARFALLMDNSDEDSRAVLVEFDRSMRQLLRKHLVEVLPGEQVTPAVNFLRAVTNGIVLDAMIAPQAWTAPRQRAVVTHALDLLLMSRE